MTIFIEFMNKHGPLGILKVMKDAVMKAGFMLLRRLPGAKGVIDRELNKVIQDIEEKVVSKDRHLAKQTALPEQGWTNDQLKSAVQRYDHAIYKPQ
jgi:hypothetical protein